MKLFVICDHLSGQGEWASFVSYWNNTNPDYVCYSPGHAHNGRNFNAPGKMTFSEIVGLGVEFDEIYFLGHGNTTSIGGINHLGLTVMIQDMKSENCKITLLACSTADEKQQLLQHNGMIGFQAGNLVTNIANSLGAGDTVNGLSVPMPFNPNAQLAFNPAQGEKVQKKGGGL